MPKHLMYRMIFIFSVMFPVLLIAEYMGNNTPLIAGVVGGVSSGVSVILFPSPEHLEKLEERKRNSKE